MKKIPFILTSILIIAWGYTSWYWYVCNIKGLCDVQSNLQNELGEEELGENQTHSGESQSSFSSATKLSATDVLTGYQGNAQTGVADTIPETAVTSSGSEEKPASSENLVKETPEDIKNTPLCNGTFTGPIAFEGTNKKDQVEILEAFLTSQGEKVDIDGEYNTPELEAVKRFQLKYKADILDPWDIVAPTGYVYTTTIKKMKEIGCQ